jgi:hypothetical protein
MTRISFTSLACALTAALALTACNREGGGAGGGAGGPGTTTTSPGGAGMGTSGATPPASAASR